MNIDLSCTSSGDANSAMANGKSDSDPGRFPTGLGWASSRMSSVPCAPLACVPDMHVWDEIDYFCFIKIKKMKS